MTGKAIAVWSVIVLSAIAILFGAWKDLEREKFFSGSVISNGDFSSEIVNDQENNPGEWFIWEAGKYGISGATVADYGVSNGTAFVDVANAGPESWHIQFNQWVELENEQAYLITFKAKANTEKSINVKILQTHEPWTNYFAETVQLNEEWQTFEFYYLHSRTSDKVVTFGFELGKDPAATVYFKDIVVKPVDKSLLPPKEEVADEGETIDYYFDEEEPGNLINNGDFSAGIVNDQGSMPFEWWIWQAGDYNISGAKVSEYGVKDGAAYLVLADTGTDSWHIQFDQWINMKQGNTYKITLKAKADTPRAINLKLVQTGAPYGMFFRETLNLETEWQVFEFEYTHPDDGDPIVNFSIELGAGAPTTVYFDDVAVEPITSE